ncbi:Tetratricopeptide (TPR) repeat [Candidatus Methanophagaceae archaeon]|jgi:tetratricopeptide (TPR) repeat protein|nr:Tetratricopeptide (TPR) repeat [Methanophagales archaeon]
MDEAKATFEGRVSRLANYLSRAYKYDKPSILFAMYLSEFLRSDVENSLESALAEQGLEVVSVDTANFKDLPSIFAAKSTDNTVFFVYNLDKGFPEVLQYLNFKREVLVEHQVKVLFWVREAELARISLEAPDFFAFRNRVVEFMEVPTTEEHRPALVEFALDAEYKSLEEFKRIIDLKEKLLAELSDEAQISGYLLGSLGKLYWQIGSYKKSLVCSEKALKIAREIGDRRGEGTWLNNIGVTFKDLEKYAVALACYLLAKKIRMEIRDPNVETTENNIKELKTKIGAVEFQKLMATVEPKAEEIIQGFLADELWNLKLAPNRRVRQNGKKEVKKALQRSS